MNSIETGFTPGAYLSITEENYHAMNLCSASRLNSLKKGPGHCYADITRPSTEERRNLILGTAVHCKVLEPERFDKCFIENTAGDRRTKEGKEAFARLVEDSKGKSILTRDEWKTVHAIDEILKSHPTFQTILETASERETTVVFNQDGVMCKARADILNDKYGIIVDIKTTSSENKEQFGRNIYKFGYHVQGAFYLRAFPGYHSFVHVCIETDGNYPVEIYRLDDEAIARGNEEIDQLIPLYRHHILEGHWSDIQDISIPTWVYNQ